MHKLLFVISGLYDGLLGLAFLFRGPLLFQYFQVTPPNHFGYIKFPALILIVFGAMFLRIASDPRKYRDMIPLGMGLKVAYVSTVFYYQMHGGLPAMWIPFAWADLGFLVLFVISWTGLRRPA